MQEYRKNNEKLGLTSFSYIVPDDDREIVASYVAQLRVMHYSKIMVTSEDVEAQEALANKRVARIQYKKNKIQELADAALLHAASKATVEAWVVELEYLARLRSDLAFELSAVDSAQGSDTKWTAVAMRYNLNSYRFNAVLELLRLTSVGKKPVVLLECNL